MSNGPEGQKPADDTGEKPCDNDAAEREALIEEITAALDTLSPEQLERLQSLLVLHIGRQKH